MLLTNKKLVQGKNAILISYEEITENPRSVFDKKIKPILGIDEYFEPKTNLKKQNKRPLSEIVENYEEVHCLLERYRQVKIDFS
jgi:hypothetical protein